MGETRSEKLAKLIAEYRAKQTEAYTPKQKAELAELRRKIERLQRGR